MFRFKKGKMMRHKSAEYDVDDDELFIVLLPLANALVKESDIMIECTTVSTVHLNKIMMFGENGAARVRDLGDAEEKRNGRNLDVGYNQKNSKILKQIFNLLIQLLLLKP